jgi:hypothetical protein
MRALSTTACALLLTTACETMESADIRTSGVHARIEVEADGSGESVVRTTLLSGGRSSNTYLELSGGDRLVATAAGIEKELVESRTEFDQVHYVAGIPKDGGGTAFTVAFERPSGNGDDAPDSHVVLPPPFHLTAPASGALLEPATQALRIAWDRVATDPVDVTVEGDCLDTWERHFDTDPGFVDIPARKLSTWGTESCHADVTVARTRHGDLDPHFGGGGTIDARQVRRTYVVVRP